MSKPRGIYTIRRYKAATGKKTWIVQGTNRLGVRVVKWRTDRAEAERIRQQLEYADKADTTKETFAKTNLRSEQLLDAELAMQILKGSSIKSLAEAASWLVDNYKAPDSTKTVHEVYEAYLADRAKANLRRRSMEDLRARLGRLDDALGTKGVHEVTASDLELLIPHEASAGTRNNYIRVWGQLFRWAKKRGYTEKDPTEAMSKARLDAKDNEALTLAQTKRLLKEAFGGKLQSMVALQLFAGLRREEVARLDWEQVDTDEMVVHVKAEGAKKRSARTIELPECLLPWLDRSQPIFPRNFRRLYDDLRERAGITDPKYNNVMRHTAISFHCARHQSIDKTLLWGGTGIEPLFANYKARVKAKDVEPYWNLTPEVLGL